MGDHAVFDTTRAHLLHETGIAPVAYIPLEDFDSRRLQRTDRTSHCPFKGDASYWSLRVGDELIEDVVWGYEEPLQEAAWLRGFAALHPDRVDRWLVEDEQVGGRLTDPYHRVDVYQSSRAVRVTAAGQTLAQSDRPVLVFPTSMPVRAYVPRGDVVAGHLVPSGRSSADPYMGDAIHFNVRAGDERFPDAAHSYELPKAEAIKVAGYVCFEGEGITVELQDA